MGIANVVTSHGTAVDLGPDHRSADQPARGVFLETMLPHSE